MKRWIMIGMCLTMASVASISGALAAFPGDAPRCKRATAGPAPTVAQIAAAARVGGDTFATALPITSTPFTDSGSTVGYTDDHDEYCGTGVGAAPDVVYAFTPPTTAWYRFDLCGSTFDTKLNVYDVNEVLVACNDDFDINAIEGELCYQNARIADFPCTAGETYYLVVDGYGDEAGDYTLTVAVWTHCDVANPGDLIAEGEPAPTSGLADEHNCGCSCTSDPVFQSLSADPSGRAVIAIVQGWRDPGFRDYDAFRCMAGSSGTVHVEFESELDATVRIMSTTDCDQLEILESARIVPCGSAVVTAAVTPGAEFAIMVFPNQYMSPWGLHPAAFEAVLTVSGLEAGVPIESTTWGALKGMYR